MHVEPVDPRALQQRGPCAFDRSQRLDGTYFVMDGAVALRDANGQPLRIRVGDR
ncbi:MAG: hypothetical protein AB7L65_03490 [Hyphomonadaceae bacterium]